MYMRDFVKHVNGSYPTRITSPHRGKANYPYVSCEIHDLYICSYKKLSQNTAYFTYTQVRRIISCYSLLFHLLWKKPIHLSIHLNKLSMWHINSFPNLNYTICNVDVLPIGWFGFSFLLINSISTSRQARSQHLPRRDDGSMASCVRSRGNHHPTTRNFGSCTFGNWKICLEENHWICLICLNTIPTFTLNCSLNGPSPRVCPFPRAPRPRPIVPSWWFLCKRRAVEDQKQLGTSFSE